MKVVHGFVADAVQIEKDEIFSINAVDKKAYPGDWLLTYEDGSQAILTNAEAKAQLIHTEKGFIVDRSHVVTEEDVVEFQKQGISGINLGDVIMTADEKPAA